MSSIKARGPCCSHLLMAGDPVCGNRGILPTNTNKQNSFLPIIYMFNPTQDLKSSFPWVQPKTPSIPYSDQLHSTKKIENVICHYIHQLLFIFTNDLSLYFGRTLPTSMVPWAFFNRRVAAFTFAPPEVSTFHTRVAGGHSWYWWDTTMGHSWCN